MNRHQNIDEVLRTLDAADDAPSPDAGRARADLDRILSTDRASHKVLPPMAPGATCSGKRVPYARSRRAVVVGSLVAAATAGLFVIPALTGGDPAFASWTATPITLSDQDRDEAVADCRASNMGTGNGMYEEDITVAEVAIAERRGAWVTVVLTGADGFDATCVTDASAPWFNKSMIGSVGKVGPETDPEPRTLQATQLGTGLIESNPISMASGRAGSDVTGITYTSVTGEEVVATVAKGQFAFWLPGDELQDASSVGATVEVTYRDGTTETQSIRF
jgi:hypothetical protein